MKLIIECDPYAEGNAARRAQEALRKMNIDAEIREIREVAHKEQTFTTVFDALKPFKYLHDPNPQKLGKA